jgi:hypothetical protein
MRKQLISNSGQSLYRLLVLALGLLAVASCGYRVVGSEPVSAGKTRATLAVPPFVNRSMQTGLETIFANDMINALKERQVVQVKAGEDKADYILLGTIKKLEHSSTAYLNIEQSLIRRATLSLEVVVKDTRSNKVVWKDTEIIRSDYVATEYYGIGEATRDQGLRQSSARFAQQISDKISLLF